MLQRSVRLMVALAVVLLSAGQSSAVEAAPASYYFSANGNDANPGTAAQPWRSLARLQTTLNGGVLQAGDQVLFARGDRLP